MKVFVNYTKFIPYLYYLIVIVYWFTILNSHKNLSPYPIILFGIPFLWQILKPNKSLNIKSGIAFACLLSLFIIAYISIALDIPSLSKLVKQFMIFGYGFILSNFIMTIWILRNSLKETI